MAMALRLFYHINQNYLTLIAGYESGHVIVSYFNESSSWSTAYISCPHSQPVLSIDILPSQDFFFSSSADAIIAKHSIPLPISSTTPIPFSQPSIPTFTLQTKHSGQQSLRVRSDGRIFATAGWDSR